MPDFPVSPRLANQYAISTASPESIGPWALSVAASISASFAWPAANLAIYVPVEIYAPATIVKMAVLNGTAVSGNIDVGIYDVGGKRLISAGTTAQAGTTTIQTFDITDTLLLPGLYYMAVALDNTTGTLGGYSGIIAGDGQAVGLLQQASAFVLPDPATFAAYAQTVCPLVLMAQRATI